MPMFPPSTKISQRPVPRGRARRVALAATLLFGVAGVASGRVMPLPDGGAGLTGAADHAEVVTAVIAQSGPVTLEQATKVAQRRHEGRVVRAETKTSGNRRLHEIRILADDGRVHRVRIDAETGQVL